MDSESMAWGRGALPWVVSVVLMIGAAATMRWQGVGPDDGDPDLATATAAGFKACSFAVFAAMAAWMGVGLAKGRPLKRMMPPLILILAALALLALSATWWFEAALHGVGAVFLEVVRRLTVDSAPADAEG